MFRLSIGHSRAIAGITVAKVKITANINLIEIPP